MYFWYLHFLPKTNENKLTSSRICLLVFMKKCRLEKIISNLSDLYKDQLKFMKKLLEQFIFKIPTQLLFQKGRPVLFAGSSSYVLELVFPRGLSTFRCLMITIFRILLDFFFGPYVSRLLEVQCKYS